MEKTFRERAAITKRELQARRFKGANASFTARSVTTHGNAHDPNHIKSSHNLEKNTDTHWHFCQNISKLRKVSKSLEKDLDIGSQRNHAERCAMFGKGHRKP